MKTALLYLALVGLPVLGVLGVLGVGERIEAPPAIGGTWRAEGDGRSCVLGESREFRVEQSGEFVRVLLADRPPISGRMRGGRLRTSGGAREGISPGCAASTVVFGVDVPAGRPDRLTGWSGLPLCSGCQPAPFSAVRVVPPPTD